ncbi:toluene tolerance protein [Azonexus sp.]|uniref:toluene tolerance protein n=1 Tax=Azonexus sp. TaxID=1872668 RepID=UPI0027B95DCC|nr:toluene tolerance protein [Azonexus sp.]
MTFQTMSLAQYQALRGTPEILEADGHGEKVLRLADDSILKLFRRKRLISSNIFYPYAQRFADNAEILLRKGIPAPQVIALYRIPEISRDVVHYAPVPGITLRQKFRENPSPPDLENMRSKICRFAQFLFDEGIYFRSLHLGNIVELPDGKFGLIDLSDMKAHRKSLSKYLRKRNVDRMLVKSEPGETAWIDAASILMVR